MAITTYENFNANQTIVYGSPATSASANKAPLFLKEELNNLSNYTHTKFGEAPLVWNPAHQYKAGDLCERNGIIFKALIDNINSQPNNANWDVINILESYRAGYEWDNSTNYNIYDVVIHSGHIYEANNANLNDEPPSGNWNDKGELMFSDEYLPLHGTADDSDKLDNHDSSYFYQASNPNGYTDDQTASEILTAIKTVDGSGSGLDADLLDGYDSDVAATANTVVVRDSSGNINGTSTEAKYADLAEKYVSDKIYEVGTVMAVGGEKEITEYKQNMPLAGVISENPGFKMNSEIDGLYIALKGRIKCKINGSTEKGDYIIADNNGKGKATKIIQDITKLVGIALENGSEVIEVKV